MKKDTNRGASPERTFVLDTLRRHRGLLALSLPIGAIETLGRVALPYILKLQLDVLEGKMPFASLFPVTPWALFCIFLLAAAAASLWSVFFATTGNMLNIRFRNAAGIDVEKRLYERLALFDAGFLQNPRNRRILQSVFSMRYLADEVVRFALKSLDSAIVIFGILPIIASIDVRIFVLVAGMSILRAMLLRQRLRYDNERRILEERASSKYHELQWLLYTQFQDIMNTGGAGRVLDRYWAIQRERYDLDLRRVRVETRFRYTDWCIDSLTTVGTGLYAGYAVLTGSISVGSFAMVVLYAGQIQTAFMSVLNLSTDFNEIRMTLVRLAFFLRMQPRFDLTSIAERPAIGTEGFALENVTFRYPGFGEEERAYLEHIVEKLGRHMERDFDGWTKHELRAWQELLEAQKEELPIVLRDATCVVERGRITALVGRNGSGKTTIVKLLMRNYDPLGGRVRIGGADMRTVHPQALHEHVALVSQEPFYLESFTIRDNVLLGVNRAVTDEEILETLASVDLLTAIRKQANGLDTIVGDEAHFSGGQYQLMAIARVLLQRRPFIILDEGTNQLDAEHEALIVRALERLKADAAVLVITHRMTTARKADRIYVLDGGRIIQDGDHASLLTEADGVYRKFWDLQVVD